MEIGGYVDETLHEEVDNGFISYIVNYIKSFESGMINTSTMITNLSAAIVFQFKLMEQSDVKFRKESARSINHSFETYSAIQKLTSLIGIVHFKGMIITL